MTLPATNQPLAGIFKLVIRNAKELLKATAGEAGAKAKEMWRRVVVWALVLAAPVGLMLALGCRCFSSGASFLERAPRVAPSLTQLWRTCVTPSKQWK